MASLARHRFRPIRKGRPPCQALQEGSAALPSHKYHTVTISLSPIASTRDWEDTTTKHVAEGVAIFMTTNQAIGGTSEGLVSEVEGEGTSTIATDSIPEMDIEAHLHEQDEVDPAVLLRDMQRERDETPNHTAPLKDQPWLPFQQRPKTKLLRRIVLIHCLYLLP